MLGKKCENFETIPLQDNVDILEDRYQGDVIGEATPDVLVSEFVSLSLLYTSSFKKSILHSSFQN